MKLKLIFVPFGIKQKTADNIERLLGIKPEVLDIKNGFLNELFWVKKYSSSKLFVTAVPSYLGQSDLWWNEKEDKFEIYFYKDGVLKNIQDLTVKKLMFGHNIERIYLNGGFKNL